MIILRETIMALHVSKFADVENRIRKMLIRVCMFRTSFINFLILAFLSSELVNWGQALSIRHGLCLSDHHSGGQVPAADQKQR